MALLTCDDCGGSVSSLAAACPHCGRPRVVAGAADYDDDLCANCGHETLAGICVRCARRRRIQVLTVTTLLLIGGVTWMISGRSPASGDAGSAHTAQPAPVPDSSDLGETCSKTGDCVPGARCYSGQCTTPCFAKCVQIAEFLYHAGHVSAVDSLPSLFGVTDYTSHADCVEKCRRELR